MLDSLFVEQFIVINDTECSPEIRDGIGVVWIEIQIQEAIINV